MRTREPVDIMNLPRPFFAILTVLFSSAGLFGQVKEPPRTERVEVHIHYRIRAERDDRIRQYRALERYLNSLGFDDAKKDDPNHSLDVFDPAAEHFFGTIPSSKVLDILNEPHVIGLLFAPSGYMYPAAGDQTVSVRITLRSGLQPLAQQALWLQSLAQLEQLGFRDALAYDTRGHTQIKGIIPYKNLDRLTNDLRTEPSGWFAANTPMDRLPRPLADRIPVRWVEVMPAVEPPPVFTPEVVLPARARFSPELRAKLVDAASKDAPLLVEVLFASPIEDRMVELRRLLEVGYGPDVRRGADGKPVMGPDGRPQLTEGTVIEGAIGNVATIRFDRPDEVERFSLEPDVLSMRLPCRGTETVALGANSPKPVNAAELLKSSGVETLHKMGYAGAGVKVIVTGTDFTGAEKLIGTVLPRKTRIVDLTTELALDILPLPGDPAKSVGNLAVARAVALAAPDAELVLVRISPDMFFELRGVVRLARGETAYSTAMRSRLIDLGRQSDRMVQVKDNVIKAYRQAFEDQSDDEPARVRRAKAKAALEAVSLEQRVLAARIERFNAFQKYASESLAGARVIVNTLVWDAGYPLDSLSELSRSLEEYAAPPPARTIRPAGGPRSVPRPPVVWVQASSPAVGAVWAGPFRDADRNGLMEFGQTLPAGSWSPELNFLGIREPGGEVSPELPAGAKVRFSVQWREPRDPRMPGLDLPAYPVVLRIFRQLDPTGEKRPSDEMTEDARSAGGPYPIIRTNTYTVYEQILEFTAPSAGRYAFVTALGYVPEPALPAMKRQVEIIPRMVIETLSAKPGAGQVVFRSYATLEAGVGAPADSRGAVAVGVANGGSLIGGGTGVALLVKPDLLGPASLDQGDPVYGPGIASGFVGGVAAALVQTNALGANVFLSVGMPQGQQPMVPEAWFRYLPPIPRAPGK